MLWPPPIWASDGESRDNFHQPQPKLRVESRDPNGPMSGQAKLGRKKVSEGRYSQSLGRIDCTRHPRLSSPIFLGKSEIERIMWIPASETQCSGLS